MSGTFEDFLSDLLAFESGWDRDRYDQGIIQDWQLDEWAGGSVQDFFPQYSSWGDLSDAEWQSMAYRSTNAFGFVGYQFGEALLIDLGYYDDDVYYLNGADTNTWDGTWTGKNGVNSLEDFMTGEAQDVAIQEAFGYNLGIIEEGLAAEGYTIDDFIGTTMTYTASDGTQTDVTVTLTGILASAHLRGSPAVVELFLNGTLSNDEFGTSILQYMDQFGGYDSPDADELITYFEDRLTGDEGLNGSESGSGSEGSAGVDADSATVTIDWNWGTHQTVTDFDPSSDTVYIGWFTSDHIDVTETAAGVVFSIPSNDQSVTLQGISLDDLSAGNFTILDSSASAEILALVGDGTSDGTNNETDTGADAGDGANDDNTPDDTTGNSDTNPDDDQSDDTSDDTGEDPVADTPADDSADGGNNSNTGGNTVDSPIIGAYFPEWGVYGIDYNVADIPADNLTHLFYAFTQIDDNGNIQLFDEWAATGIAFGADESVDGVADIGGQDLYGNFNQLRELKEANPDLSIMLSIGGWTLSDNFSTVLATEQGRENFANSVVEFLQEYPFFDGVDIDWEYPGGGGLAGNATSPDDGENYALALAEVREALDGLEAETGRDYQMSVAAPAGFDKIENFNAEGLEPYLDFFNVMTYDYYGSTWETNTTGHNAPFYDQTGANIDPATGASYDIESTIQLYLDAGVPAEKLVMGAPMYSYAWSGVDAASAEEAVGASASGAFSGTVEFGKYHYKELAEWLEDPNSGWKLYWDDDAQAAFVWNEAQQIFGTIETPATVALKSEWAQDLGLGGMFFWDLSNDTDDAESLINAAYESWVEETSFEDIANASQLEFEQVIGGDGEFSSLVDGSTPDNSTGNDDAADDSDDTADDSDDTADDSD
ncbi:glycoside hydrolase family 18 protein, partial [Roseibium sp. RKSG952]|uniref:glycoside hydrolase family 18 protein n=1 Tax=Roseibium sp. RKSG952 TaxID=2529384 RepID=UPI0013C89709